MSYVFLGAVAKKPWSQAVADLSRAQTLLRGVRSLGDFPLGGDAMAARVDAAITRLARGDMGAYSELDAFFSGQGRKYADMPRSQPQLFQRVQPFFEALQSAANAIAGIARGETESPTEAADAQRALAAERQRLADEAKYVPPAPQPQPSGSGGGAAASASEGGTDVARTGLFVAAVAAAGLLLWKRRKR